MRKLAVMMLAAGGLWAATAPASAQIYFGSRDAAVQIAPYDYGPRYEYGPRHRVYREPRYYRDYAYEGNRRYYRSPKSSNGCPPRYTVQDGVCKPYRGY